MNQLKLRGFKFPRVPFSLFLGVKYLKARSREKMIPLITAISIFGVAIGVMALIVVLSVMGGFDRDLKKRILGVYPSIDVRIKGDVLPDYKEKGRDIEEVPNVVAAAPYVSGQIMAKIGNRIFGVILRGIDPEKEAKVSLYKEYLEKETYNLDPEKHPYSLVIGSEFARQFGVEVGDEIELVSPIAIPTPLGMASNNRKFLVAGIFDSGMFEYDLNLVYCPLSAAQKMFGIGDSATGMAVKVRNLRDVFEVQKTLREKLGSSFSVRTWIDINRNLFRALLTEKWVMFWILFLIVTVAAFNIASTLIMVVMEKTKEIGIIKALGATRWDVMKVFFFQGGTIGAFGTVIGFIGGMLLTYQLNTISNFIAKTTGFELFPKDIYYLDKIPTEVSYPEAGLVCAGALLLSIVASLYPAWRASRLDPSEAIRYE